MAMIARWAVRCEGAGMAGVLDTHDSRSTPRVPDFGRNAVRSGALPALRYACRARHGPAERRTRVQAKECHMQLTAEELRTAVGG